jgi:Tat protein secretion system quality control protein TatD with DNase activity
VFVHTFAGRGRRESLPSIQDMARLIPLDRPLLETDNPGGYEWLTKKPGMPDPIFEVLSKVASLRGIEPGELEVTRSIRTEEEKA